MTISSEVTDWRIELYPVAEVEGQGGDLEVLTGQQRRGDWISAEVVDLEPNAHQILLG